MKCGSSTRNRTSGCLERVGVIICRLKAVETSVRGTRVLQRCQNAYQAGALCVEHTYSLFISWQPRMSLRYSGRPGNKKSASTYIGNVCIEQAIQAMRRLRKNGSPTHSCLSCLGTVIPIATLETLSILGFSLQVSEGFHCWRSTFTFS